MSSPQQTEAQVAIALSVIVALFLGLLGSLQVLWTISDRTEVTLLRKPETANLAVSATNSVSKSSWNSTSLGGADLGGFSTGPEGSISVWSVGEDLWGTSDSAFMVHQPLPERDFLTATVRAHGPVGVVGHHFFAKACLTIQMGLESSAPYVGIALTSLRRPTIPSATVVLLRREERGGPTAFRNVDYTKPNGPWETKEELLAAQQREGFPVIGNGTGSVWLQLEKNGTRITGRTALSSEDGRPWEWTALGTAIDLAELHPGFVKSKAVVGIKLTRGPFTNEPKGKSSVTLSNFTVR
ncbi:hypothetical protein CYMTET_16218 [Cymbomonas tetramitiformis]|uniref:Uncharacterized protein n=1 Tax=Cymbomonas tetramitiformis TaxID=36881 RepID=A0AAE0GD08_9CHLO|nr:hypothetical protein CYMTET_16218 [Cymbomonas tetramitiformis]